jgi:hypothetical protein
LSPKCCETRTGYRRNSLVTWIGDDIEQFLDLSFPKIISGRIDDAAQPRSE